MEDTNLQLKPEKLPSGDNQIIRDENGRIVFTKEMKRDYTILIPSMAPFHFELLTCVFRNHGYNFELLTNQGSHIAEVGLKYVHNDTCYPALLVIGQMIDALNSGKYDLKKTALIITQTGGGCRASNYIHLLRKALVKAGYDYIPVISLNVAGLEKNSGFKLSVQIIRECIAALIYGDCLMAINNQVKPYEVNIGESNELVQSWITNLSDQFKQGKGLSTNDIGDNSKKIVADFAKIQIKKVPKIKVGIVGEIYVKYASLGNNDLEQFLYEQGCEVCLPGILGFMLYTTDNGIQDYKLYGGSFAKYKIFLAIKGLFVKMEDKMIDAFKGYDQFVPPSSYQASRDLAKGVIGYGNKMGEGWLLTAEMMELIHSGFENIVCAQPFGCLPNHICGKGMIRKIKGIHDNANIVAIDYDPGATRVNQENRIKLMLSIAKEVMDEKV